LRPAEGPRSLPVRRVLPRPQRVVAHNFTSAPAAARRDPRSARAGGENPPLRAVVRGLAAPSARGK